MPAGTAIRPHDGYPDRVNGDTAKSITAAVVSGILAALTTYFASARPAIQEVNAESQQRHVVSCANAEVNRALIRQAAEGLLEPLPVPAGALPALRQFIELGNAERDRARSVIAANTRTPVECLR